MKCKACGAELMFEELEVRDYGNFEEFWGAAVWRPDYSYYCPVCGSEIYPEEE